MNPRYVIISDPGSMRSSVYERELRSFWEEQQQRVEIWPIDWRDVCDTDGRIERWLPDSPAMLRIESPARDPDVIRRLCEAGRRAVRRAREGLSVPTVEADASDGGFGWIHSPRLVFAGLRSCLQGIATVLQQHPRIRSFSVPEDITVTFDKNATSERLRHAGVPVPDSFCPQGTAAELCDELRERRWRQTFVKLSHGSCASGIVVLNVVSGAEWGMTTVVERDGRFYNTFDVSHVRGARLNHILQFLIEETATVQQFVPKARLCGRNFDLRVVVLDGTVIAVIGRASQHPMTNLHLGGQQCSVDDCRRIVGQRAWLDAMDACVAAAEQFRLNCVGVDVAINQFSGQPQILELNAFGDFFPRWRDTSGRSIHRLQIDFEAAHWRNQML
ncbi:MAG: STM4014 family protein [Planctomycetaceae bacterium]|nr:STM4014 family protein [Planctomycetaceae bacterium]